MATFHCKMCGAALQVDVGTTVIECEYCHVQQTLPRLDDDRKVNMYDRANHFRRNNEFDKASGIYEQILNEDSTDAEAYWSLVLCRYGVEYVNEPSSHKRIPTIHRAQFTSVYDDDNYKMALQYCDSLQRIVFENEAKAINEIQKGFLAISQKEKPYDVFICYKETDDNGKQRTHDSVLANDLYHQLTQEGLNVFFSRITLENKLGTAYEPYIFAALNSAKVMVVIGTKKEYFNAVWVKNEWSRFLSLIKQGEKKVLIPAYRDMDPYDLPDEFSHLQAQDMSKLGFMQDLIHGIKKMTAKDAQQETASQQNANIGNVDSYLKRVKIFLEDSEWKSAVEYCEKILDIEPENAMAYLGNLMAEYHVCKREGLKDLSLPFDNNKHYNKIMRFGDESLKKELLSYLEFIKDRNEEQRLSDIYANAMAFKSKKTEADYKKASGLFHSIRDYKDSAQQVEECKQLAKEQHIFDIYANAMAFKSKKTESDYTKAADLFRSIRDYKDSAQQVEECEKERAFKRQLRKNQEERARIDRENQEEEARKNRVLAQANEYARNVYDKKGGVNSYNYQKALELYTSIEGWQDANTKKKNLIAFNKKQNAYRVAVPIISLLTCIGDAILTLYLMSLDYSNDQSIAMVVFTAISLIVPVVFWIMFALVRNHVNMRGCAIIAFVYSTIKALYFFVCHLPSCVEISAEFTIIGVPLLFSMYELAPALCGGLMTGCKESKDE